MNMGRPPRIWMIPPRVGAWLDGFKLVATFLVGEQLPLANKVGVNGCGVLVDQVPIAARGIGLPDLHKSVAYRPALLVQHSSSKQNLLSQGSPFALRR